MYWQQASVFPLYSLHVRNRDFNMIQTNKSIPSPLPLLLLHLLTILLLFILLLLFRLLLLVILLFLVLAVLWSVIHHPHTRLSVNSFAACYTVSDSGAIVIFKRGAILLNFMVCPLGWLAEPRGVTVVVA